MTFPVNIYNVTSVPATGGRSGNDITLNVDDVYHAVIGATLSIGTGATYTIVSWDENYAIDDNVMQLVVNDSTGSNPITATSFNFYPPFFAHGTVKEEGAQLVQQNNVWNKYPLIWAREPVKERFFNDREDAHERESNIEIYFLTNADFSIENFNTYELYARPMTRLKDNFIKILNTETGNWPIGSTDRNDMTIDVTEITKVSVTIGQKDVTKTIFADNLSGVAAEFKLKILAPEGNIFGQQ